MITVNYEFVAGKHFFTSATNFGRGLCVAHSDLKTAHDEVGRQLKIILLENHQVRVDDAFPAAFEVFQEFLNAIPDRSDCVRVQCAGDRECMISRNSPLRNASSSPS